MQEARAASMAVACGGQRRHRSTRICCRRNKVARCYARVRQQQQGPASSLGRTEARRQESEEQRPLNGSAHRVRITSPRLGQGEGVGRELA